jgi:hypothetical protein
MGWLGRILVSICCQCDKFSPVTFRDGCCHFRAPRHKATTAKPATRLGDAMGSKLRKILLCESSGEKNTMGASNTPTKPCCCCWTPEACIFWTPLLYFVRQGTHSSRRPVLSQLRLSRPANYEHAIDGTPSSANYEHATGYAPTAVI